VLALRENIGLDQIVNQQIRFVLGDAHWDELKKLSATGRAWVERSGVAADVMTNACG